MDGVVIDSEKLHLQALGLTLEQNGIAYPKEIMNDFVGLSDTAFFRYAKKELNPTIDIAEFIRQKDALFDSLLPGLQFIDGFPQFMERVRELGLKTALVTSSSKHTVRKADEVLNYTRLFDVVIAEEDTNKHKPYPEPYLLALEKTLSAADFALVIEDSINGIKAGKAAGCVACGLTTSFAPDVLTDAGADFALDSYEQISERFFN